MKIIIDAGSLLGGGRAVSSEHTREQARQRYVFIWLGPVYSACILYPFFLLAACTSFFLNQSSFSMDASVESRVVAATLEARKTTVSQSLTHQGFTRMFFHRTFPLDPL